MWNTNDNTRKTLVSTYHKNLAAGIFSTCTVCTGIFEQVADKHSFLQKNYWDEKKNFLKTTHLIQEFSPRKRNRSMKASFYEKKIVVQKVNKYFSKIFLHPNIYSRVVYEKFRTSHQSLVAFHYALCILNINIILFFKHSLDW